MQSNGSPIDRLDVFIISLLLCMHFDTHCGFCSGIRSCCSRGVYFVFRAGGLLFMQAAWKSSENSCCIHCTQNSNGRARHPPLNKSVRTTTYRILCPAPFGLLADRCSPSAHRRSPRPACLQGNLRSRQKLRRNPPGSTSERPASIIDGAWTSVDLKSLVFLGLNIKHWTVERTFRSRDNNFCSLNIIKVIGPSFKFFYCL